MRQPITKPSISYKTYSQNIYKTFYRPIKLIYILDPLSILLITLIETLLIRNSNNILRL
jgi:hypothetical protein